MDLAKVIRQSLGLWHGPGIQALPPEDVVWAANRCFMRYSLDLELTPDAVFYARQSTVFTFQSSDAREIVLTDIDLEDLSRIIRVETRLIESENEDDYSEQTIVSYDGWPDTLDEGDTEAVSFYHDAERGYVMAVGQDSSTLDFRITYHALRDRIETTDEVVNIPAVYELLFVYDLALEMGELIDDRSLEWLRVKSDKMQFLTLRIQNEYERVEKWRRAQTPGGPTRRKAFNDRTPIFDIGHRKFTVHW